MKSLSSICYRKLAEVSRPWAKPDDGPAGKTSAIDGGMSLGMGRQTCGGTIQRPARTVQSESARAGACARIVRIAALRSGNAGQRLRNWAKQVVVTQAHVLSEACDKPMRRFSQSGRVG